jgi:glycosidase
MMFVRDWCHKYTYILLLLFCLAENSSAQTTVYPPFWWKGMENDTLHLILHNEKGFSKIPAFSGDVVEVLDLEIAENTHYVFASLFINEHGKDSDFRIKVGRQRIKYLLKDRENRNVESLDQSDVMYLITPDRFANGDPKNDYVEGMAEKVYSRDSIYGRHGGDIQGIINQLDYIQNLGFNSLWICPLQTNDQEVASYHGYAITDHYSIDPRFGSNALYAELVDKMHQKGMKMVMDVVYNHVGLNHHLFTDLPDSNFFHFHKGYSKGYKQTNYRAATLFDPHVSDGDAKTFKDGWFVRDMPDINQQHSPMAQYLIQNSIWWIEEFGIDAFRIDTYTYPDQAFMADLARRIKKEYPNFFIFGETWVHGPEIQSYFVEKNPFNPIESHMDAVTDFQLAFAIQEAVSREQGWTEGVAKVYYRLAADYLYRNPEKHVTFLDNHDLARIFGHVNGDLNKMEIALGMLFTMRGIPCMYYGTEILMRGVENHGVIREDFPGGWVGDEINKFDPEQLSENEGRIQSYITHLLAWRSSSKAITQGKLKHFVPQDGVYVYFRYHEEDVVMVVVNSNNNKDVEVDLSRFEEIWPQGAKGKDVMSDTIFESNVLKTEALSIQIFQLQ